MSIWIEGVFSGTFTYFETAVPFGDDWATLIAWANSGGALFDRVKVSLRKP